MNDIQGWINLYKPKNISSFLALKKIKKKFSINKIGHCGTLDPLAEGILPVAIGKTTKLIQFINSDFKKYIFKIKWGEETSTNDSEGIILNTSNNIPTKKIINNAINSFIGEILQKPPKSSAIKINGIRAYKLFRKNIDFEVSPKKVFVKSLKNISNVSNSSLFEIECGKGFYVRSFARDFAHYLGTYAHIIDLKRTRVGKFSLDRSILLDDLMKIGQRLSEFNYVLSSASMLDDILAIEIEDINYFDQLSLGKSIILKENDLYKSKQVVKKNKTVFLSRNGNIISYGKLNGNLFRPNKVLI